MNIPFRIIIVRDRDTDMSFGSGICTVLFVLEPLDPKKNNEIN